MSFVIGVYLINLSPFLKIQPNPPFEKNSSLSVVAGSATFDTNSGSTFGSVFFTGAEGACPRASTFFINASSSAFAFALASASAFALSSASTAFVLPSINAAFSFLSSFNVSNFFFLSSASFSLFFSSFLFSSAS